MKVITDERSTSYSRSGHPERPQRISNSLQRLRTQTAIPIEWLSPPEAADPDLLLAHTTQHLEAVQNPWTDFDGDTPAYPDIAAHARRSTGAALQAMQESLTNQPAFSLMRPPGHHATQDRAMGFCYFNSVAVAALAARDRHQKKVAVFDFDVHHGNGTESILLHQDQCAFFSVHQHPAYPGTGAKSQENCRNFPVPPGSDRPTYRHALGLALRELREFKPDLIAVSAGFDAYRLDPLSDEPLEAEDFHWIGRQIRALDLPAFSVLEGGYSKDLPELILSYLKGLLDLPLQASLDTNSALA